MEYYSTRSARSPLPGHQAVIRGLSPDGGLYVPDNLNCSIPWNTLIGKSYQEIAESLGRHVKSIDNALQRVKRKLEKYLEENGQF